MTSPTPSAPRIIKVSVISDITCPWCYVANTEIDSAIARLQLPADAKVKFELEHKPYLLNPGWQDDEWRMKKDFMIEKLGKDKLTKVHEMLNSRGKGLGIILYVTRRPDTPRSIIDCILLSGDDGIICSTWRPHRLLVWAWNKSGSDAQSKLLKALYQATFERGENVSDVEVLAKYAEECGIASRREVSFVFQQLNSLGADVGQATEFLKTDELKADVQRMASFAQSNGVSGVPFTVIDGRWAISGGQSSEVYYEVRQIPWKAPFLY